MNLWSDWVCWDSQWDEVKYWDTDPIVEDCEECWVVCIWEMKWGIDIHLLSLWTEVSCEVVRYSELCLKLWDTSALNWIEKYEVDNEV